MSDDPIADRRQRARIEYYDDCSRRRDAVEGSAIALDAAIEVATQVKITEDVEDAAEAACGDTIHDYDGAEMRNVIRAVFRAAGFEVVE